MAEQITVRPRQGAEMLGMSRAEFMKRLARGEFESIKAGNMRLILVDSLKAWVARRLTEGAR